MRADALTKRCLRPGRGGLLKDRRVSGHQTQAAGAPWNAGRFTDDVRRLLDEGLDKKAAAQCLRLALSTVYEMRRRGDSPRRRQYLG